MNALEWLKKQQADSLRRKALFDARPRVAASQAWSGYADKPGGQQLMVRQPQPEVKNKLVEKRGNATLTKEWVDPDDSYIKATPLPRVEDVKGTRLPPLVYKRGFKPSPAREISSGWLDRMIRNNPFNRGSGNITGNVPGAQATRPAPWTIRDVAGGYDRHPRVAPRGADIPVTNDMVSAPRETWGGDLNLTMPQHHLTRGWIQDPSTILNIGNLIKSMGGTFQGIDDRLERNRIRRLMEHRTANPYYRGGLY